jgi:lipopolysaccharide transport system ATP-binding protein
MTSKIAIKAENISKQYRLGEVGTGTISHDLNRWWAKIRGKEDPFLKIGESNDRTSKGQSDYVWSLRDINFEIEQGDAVGIIGRNGAGKSTLLKLLSKVTKPTTGSFKVKGRIASLLEVGTGFNPEMTGRENIYLNGAILGMRHHEIKRKFDEIVDFAGVERYIDTPVKRYSSGMYVRLAFAVAAHLESEILIVDEVLAVGDLEFQKKCLGKMGDLSKGEGRTVLFVSHNIPSLQVLCNKGILLANGMVKAQGTLSQALTYYSDDIKEGIPLLDTIKYKQNIVQITKFLINQNTSNVIELEDSSQLSFDLDVFFTEKATFDMDIHLKKDEAIILSYADFVKNKFKTFEKGTYRISFTLTIPELRTGFYTFDIFFADPLKVTYAFSTDLISVKYTNLSHHTALNNSSLKWGSVLVNTEKQITIV